MGAMKSDYTTMVRETMGDLETKRGLVAAELSACEGDLRKMRGEFPGGEHAAAHKRGSLALEAVLGDEDAAAELEALARREEYLVRRVDLCRDAMAHADMCLEATRNTWLTGQQASGLPLQEIPEVLREHVRRAREPADA